MFTSWKNAVRDVELTEEQMKDRVCSCPENPEVGIYGEDSWLPCMSFAPDLDLSCKACIFCTPKEI